MTALIGLLVIFAIYFLPCIVATLRKHRQQLAIFVLNLLLGWTLVGWVVAMVWACTADVEIPRSAPVDDPLESPELRERVKRWQIERGANT